VTLETLLALVRDGQHAASDYLEDALTTGVTTIGARRTGGGLAGEPFATNVEEALQLAADRDPGIVVLEGSGRRSRRSMGRGRARRPATCPVEYVRGYLGPYRLLRADLAVVTMAADRISGRRTAPTSSRISKAPSAMPMSWSPTSGRRRSRRRRTPSLLRDHRAAGDRRATGRAPGSRARRRDRRVVGTARGSSRARGRPRWAEEHEVLLTELKAAAVDVASVRAVARDADVVFVDNRPVPVDGAAELDARSSSSSISPSVARPSARRKGRSDERALGPDAPDPDLRSRDRTAVLQRVARVADHGDRPVAVRAYQVAEEVELRLTEGREARSNRASWRRSRWRSSATSRGSGTPPITCAGSGSSISTSRS
jgi:hypothetical protein